jgi:hypothetical protein
MRQEDNEAAQEDAGLLTAASALIAMKGLRFGTSFVAAAASDCGT